MSKYGLSNRNQALLIFIAFLLVPIIAYLQTSEYAKSNQITIVLLFLLPALLVGIKEVVGSSQPGILSANTQAALMFVAVTLAGLATYLTVQTQSPLLVFSIGLLAAVVAGIKEFLGSQPPPTPVPITP